MSKEQNLEKENKALHIPDVVRSYADKGVFIEILADCFKLEKMTVCWRGYVHYKKNGEWYSEDIGCTGDWMKTFNLTTEFADKFCG